MSCRMWWAGKLELSPQKCAMSPDQRQRGRRHIQCATINPPARSTDCYVLLEQLTRHYTPVPVTSSDTPLLDTRQQSSGSSSQNPQEDYSNCDFLYEEVDVWDNQRRRDASLWSALGCTSTEVLDTKRQVTSELTGCHAQRLLPLLALEPSSQVLELKSGRGRLALSLAVNATYQRHTAVEWDPAQHALAAQVAEPVLQAGMTQADRLDFLCCSPNSISQDVYHTCTHVILHNAGLDNDLTWQLLVPLLLPGSCVKLLVTTAPLPIQASFVLLGQTTLGLWERPSASSQPTTAPWPAGKGHSTGQQATCYFYATSWGEAPVATLTGLLSSKAHERVNIRLGSSATTSTSGRDAVPGRPGGDGSNPAPVVSIDAAEHFATAINDWKEQVQVHCIHGSSGGVCCLPHDLLHLRLAPLVLHGTHLHDHVQL